MRRLRIDNRKMAKESCDNGRKNKHITSRRVPIYIYMGKNKVREEINSETLNKG